MKGSDRMLVGIVVGVVLLAGIALVVGLVSRGGGEKLLPDASPQGVVQRFLLAVQARDYSQAYGYLDSKLKQRCSYDYFLEQRPKGDVEELQAALVDTKTFDGRAEVTIAVTRFRTSGPFLDPFHPASSNSFKQFYTLTQEDGQWRFSQPPWPLYWCPPPELPSRPVTPPPMP